MPEDSETHLPKVAGDRPAPVRVLKGHTYFWCRCGLSRNQPFCDNSHEGTGLQPIPFTAPKDEIVFFCTCKHSQDGVRCDGKTHQRLARRKP